MLKTLLALAASAAAGFGFTYAVATSPETMQPAPMFEIVATTVDGNEYIAGRGDSCVTAADGLILPINWQSIVCREITSNGRFTNGN